MAAAKRSLSAVIDAIDEAKDKLNDGEYVKIMRLLKETYDHVDCKPSDDESDDESTLVEDVCRCNFYCADDSWNRAITCEGCVENIEDDIDDFSRHYGHMDEQKSEDMCRVIFMRRAECPIEECRLRHLYDYYCLRVLFARKGYRWARDPAILTVFQVEYLADERWTEAMGTLMRGVVDS
jgi:hypothetical protein